MAATGNTVLVLNHLGLYDKLLKDWVGKNLEESLLVTTTSIEYEGLRALDMIDPKFIYFLTDTQEIYKGDICYGKDTDLSEYMTKAEIEKAISDAVDALSTFDKEIVDTLPQAAAADPNVLYLRKNPDAKGNDVYEEWIIIGGKWTMIGDTSTDLTGYATEEYVNQKTSNITTHVGTVDDGSVGCIWLA